MSGRLQLIEQKLLAIDSSGFQNLCDAYLFASNTSSTASINRTGSQLGKRQTVKGTPDTFFRLDNGRLSFVEHTTRRDDILKKLKEDIEKCLDATKTRIPIGEISSLVLCFNSRLSSEEEYELFKCAKAKSIHLKLIGIDLLALELFSHYSFLAKEFLGIHIDSGQVLSLAKFIEEYNNKAGKLATPVDNIFFHRSEELKNLQGHLSTTDIVVLSGFPGVGKTKLAIKTTEEFLGAHPEYDGYAIVNKEANVYEDLRIHLQGNRNCILFVDDANRQLVNLKQILGIFREYPQGKFKLLLTVRDYAYNELIGYFSDYGPESLHLNKFTDEEITAIIKSDSFNIKHPTYQDKIVRLADGNARLAIMAARLANIKQQEFLIGDVSELYDTYFGKFLKDLEIFNNETLLKTLGLISFFNTVDRSNKEFIEKLLTDFGLKYVEFNEAINILENKELVEVRYDHVRISEQILGTYFFYRVFIKDSLLSFEKLLNNYFPDRSDRFIETVIPSNNTFGYLNVRNKLSLILDTFLAKIYDDQERVFQFFSLFWFYKQEELLIYTKNLINKLPIAVDPVYKLDERYETPHGEKDPVLEHLSKLWIHESNNLQPSLELAFEYCKRKPETFSELVRYIKATLLFDVDDLNFGFERQKKAWKLLIGKAKEGSNLHREVCLELAGAFLHHHYRTTGSGRKDTVVIRDFTLPSTPEVKEVRSIIWNGILEITNDDVNIVIKTVNTALPNLREASMNLAEFDLSILESFILSHLDRHNIEHVHFVYSLAFHLRQIGLKNSNTLKKLKANFKSSEYELLLKLDWNYFRGREEYEFNNIRDFDRLKAEDISSTFIFTNTDDVDRFIELVQKAWLVKNNSGHHELHRSLEVVAITNFRSRPDLAMYFLSTLFRNYPKGLHGLFEFVKEINQSEIYAMQLWQELRVLDNSNFLYWKIGYFNILSPSFINQYYKEEFVKTIHGIDQACYLHLENYEKFANGSSDLIIQILEVVSAKIEQEGHNICIHASFFKNYPLLQSIDKDLLMKVYIQQENLQQFFDYQREGLIRLCELDSQFLVKFITNGYTKREFYNKSEDDLTFAWSLEDCEKVIEESSEVLVTRNRNWLNEDHLLNVFFVRLQEDEKPKAKKFILNFITKYNRDYKRMNIIFDVLRNSVKEMSNEAFTHYLGLNSDLEAFKKISWFKSSGVYSGKVIFGEMRAQKLQSLLDKVENCENQLDLLDIRVYLKNRISQELKGAEVERKQQFIRED
jgi:hypothetical protein